MRPLRPRPIPGIHTQYVRRAELFMSVATVKAHVSRLLVKLGVANRVQVAILAHDAGLDR